jgi:MoaD family protein
MKVAVKSFADLRDVIENEVQVELIEGETIAGLLGALCNDHAGLRNALFDPSGMIRPYVNILKNGRNIHFLNGLETLLSEGDVIALFPPAAGG